MLTIKSLRRLGMLAGMVTLGITPLVHAENLYPVFTDLNTSNGLMFGGVDIYDNTVQMDWDETAVLDGNQVLRATLVGGGDFAGIGFGVPVSNGENGIDETDCQGPGGTCDGTGNVDIPNSTPVNPAIAAVNANGVIPGKLNNGNVVRGSIWMRSDPNDPATGVGSPGPASMPQVEAIFKWEAWKEAGSAFGDFEGPGDSDYGDRIWDQDQQGAAGSFADINGDGFSGGFGAPVTVTLSTTEWRQLVVEYVVDDTPDDPGNTFFPWDIGFDSFTVADVEDIRLAFFAGDFTGSTNFAGGGSWLMDNMLLEVFEDQAAADAVDPAISNPAPVAVMENADFDGDGDVDGQDFLIWERGHGVGTMQSEGDANFSGNVDGADLTIWQNQYGSSIAATVAAVPEPSTILLLLTACCCLGRTRVKCR